MWYSQRVLVPMGVEFIAYWIPECISIGSGSAGAWLGAVLLGYLGSVFVQFLGSCGSIKWVFRGVGVRLVFGVVSYA